MPLRLACLAPGASKSAYRIRLLSFDSFRPDDLFTLHTRVLSSFSVSRMASRALSALTCSHIARIFTRTHSFRLLAIQCAGSDVQTNCSARICAPLQGAAKSLLDVSCAHPLATCHGRCRRRRRRQSNVSMRSDGSDCASTALPFELEAAGRVDKSCQFAGLLRYASCNSSSSSVGGLEGGLEGGVGSNVDMN